MKTGDVPGGRLPLIGHLDTLLEKFLRGLLPEERRYLFLVPVVGLLAGFMAVGFEKLLDAVQSFCWVRELPAAVGSTLVPAAADVSGTEPDLLSTIRRLADSVPGLVVLIPTLGGIVVAVSLLLLGARQKHLEGTAGLMEALAFKKGKIPFWPRIVDGFVSIVAVGTGASLGRESAMLSSGAALGSWLGGRFRLADHHVRILLACGAAAGMAAAYDAPIGATIFAMEILLGSFAIELFGPIIVCAVLSTTVSQVIFGSEAVYKVPHYRFVNEWEIVIDLIVGGLLGIVSVGFIRVFSGLQDLFRWLEPIPRSKPVLAMFGLGVVGIFFPELFGNGYDAVNFVLGGSHNFTIRALFLLPFLKIFATALCRTGGVPGGLFTPSLFIGAFFGSGMGLVINQMFPSGSVSEPGLYALIGMGAIVSGTLQAPITAILMIFELTRDYGIILPLMSACIASAVVSHLLQKGSLYTEPLRRRGIYLPSASAPTWIRQPEVKTVLTTEVVTVSPNERFKDLTEKFLRAPEGQEHLYVTNAEGACLGVISLHDIKRFIQEAENLDSVIAADLLNVAFPFVFATDPISRAIEVLGEHNFECLPVLDGPDTRRLLGTVSKRRLLVAYSERNLARREGPFPE